MLKDLIKFFGNRVRGIKVGTDTETTTTIGPDGESGTKVPGEIERGKRIIEMVLM